ncbi:MAG: TonB-dependent receptor [Pseudomonadota bacterium]
MAQRISNSGLPAGKPLLILLTAVACWVIGTGASNAAEKDDSAIDEIVVSVSRRATASSDISAVHTVVDQSQVELSQIAIDALDDAPGVYLQQTTPGQGAVILRGLRGSSILHLVDGMRLNNAIFRDAPTQYAALVPVSAIERVEVIRGTPTSLYGSDAVGGAVQFVTRLPTFTEAEPAMKGHVVAGLNSAERLRSLRATVDAGHQALAGSVSVEHLSTDNRQVGQGDTVSNSDYSATAARAVLVYTPDDQQQTLLDVHYANQPLTPRSDELTAGFGQTEPASAEFFFEPDRRVFVHAAHRRDDAALGLDWNASVIWQRVDDDRRTRDFGSDRRRRERNRSDLAGVMVTAGRNFSTGDWLVGGEYYHDTISSARTDTDIVDGTSSAVTPRFPDGATLDQAAVFWHANMQPGERHAFQGGIRLSRVVTDLPSTALSPSAKVSTTDWSGDIGWQWDIDSRWQAIANLGAGFRAPNIFDLGTLGARPGNRFNVPNTSLASERVVHGDVGFRFRQSDWQMEAVIFALDYRDRIASRSTGETTVDGRDIVQSGNAATSDLRGAELNLTGYFGERTRIDANVLYTRGTQSIDGITEPADRIPPLSARLAASFTLRPAFDLRVEWQTADRQNRLSDRDIADPRIDPAGTPGWSVVNAMIDWRGNDATNITLGIDNLFDRRFRQHGSGIDAVGRNFSVVIRHRW